MEQPLAVKLGLIRRTTEAGVSPVANAEGWFTVSCDSRSCRHGAGRFIMQIRRKGNSWETRYARVYTEINGKYYHKVCKKD